MLIASADFELGFGVTSKIWDYVFNTVLPVAKGTESLKLA